MGEEKSTGLAQTGTILPVCVDLNLHNVGGGRVGRFELGNHVGSAVRLSVEGGVVWVVADFVLGGIGSDSSASLVLAAARSTSRQRLALEIDQSAER